MMMPNALQVKVTFLRIKTNPIRIFLHPIEEKWFTPTFEVQKKKKQNSNNKMDYFSPLPPYFSPSGVLSG